MTERQPRPKSFAQRSGSETRRRGAVVRVRCSDAEREALTAKATAEGLSVGGYLRLAGLGRAGRRTRRARPVDQDALWAATAALNKVGSNLNQIAHRLNAEGARSVAADSTLVLTRAAVESIMALTGRRGRR